MVFNNLLFSAKHTIMKKMNFLKISIYNYSLSQNGWDTLGSPCPLNVGVQDLVTKPR